MKATCVFCYQMSRHICNVDCGFNHMSLIWPDSKFNGEVNDSCLKLIGAIAFELWIIL